MSSGVALDKNKGAHGLGNICLWVIRRCVLGKGRFYLERGSVRDILVDQQTKKGNGTHDGCFLEPLGMAYGFPYRHCVYHLVLQAQSESITATP